MSACRWRISMWAVGMIPALLTTSSAAQHRAVEMSIHGNHKLQSLNGNDPLPPPPPPRATTSHPLPFDQGLVSGQCLRVKKRCLTRRWSLCKAVIAQGGVQRSDNQATCVVVCAWQILSTRKTCSGHWRGHTKFCHDTKTCICICVCEFIHSGGQQY